MNFFKNSRFDFNCVLSIKQFHFFFKNKIRKEFKAKVVLEALREESTIQEIAVKFGVPPNQISQWKAQAIAGMADLFERPNKKSEEVRQQDEKENEYLKTIGEQKVELDYLKKSTGNFTE